MTLPEHVATWVARNWADVCNAKSATYKGIPIKKLPFDLWIYQEILHERRPDVIVEIGSWTGASTLWLADHAPWAAVVSVDIKRDDWAVDPLPHNIELVTGNVKDKDVLAKLWDGVHLSSCMVIHDAEHHEEPVLRDMRNLAPLVTKGQYLIVEDGIIDSAGWKPHDPGPLPAIKRFLTSDDGKDFRRDEKRERYEITWNPWGYLERVR